MQGNKSFVASPEYLFTQLGRRGSIFEQRGVFQQRNITFGMRQNSQRGKSVDEAVTFAIKLGHCLPAEISCKRSRFMAITPPRLHERGHAVTSFHKRSVQRLISSAFASKAYFDSVFFASSATVSKFSSARVFIAVPSHHWRIYPRGCRELDCCGVRIG